MKLKPETKTSRRIFFAALCLFASLVGLMAWAEMIHPLTAPLVLAAFAVGLWAVLDELTLRPRNWKTVAAVAVVSAAPGLTCAALDVFVFHVFGGR